MSVAEKLLCDYVSNWRFHPEARPDYYELFDKAIGGDGWPNLKKLRELESQFARDNVRLVFSRSEAAGVISRFYRMFLRDPLETELEKGNFGKSLLRFFSPNEVGSLGIQPATTEEEKERLMSKLGTNMLHWFDSITPEKIDLDIRHVLEEHDRMGEHMEGLPADATPEEKLWSCAHESEYVRLDSFRRASYRRPSIFLKPARGLDASDYVIEMGWEIVSFPNFLVVAGEGGV